MCRGVSQYLPQGMETSIPPAQQMRSPYPTASYELKPLPPPPPPKSEGRWSHFDATRPGGSAWKPMSTRPLASPTEASSVYSQDSPLETTKYPQNWTFFDSSQSSTASDRRQTSLAPPRPPREPLGLGLTQLPNSSDTCLSSYGPYRFEAAPAMMAQTDISARDMYHATTAQIAHSSRGMAPPEGGEQKAKSRFFSKDSLSFASKALQSGRKKPPSSVRTDKMYAPGQYPERTPYPAEDGRDPVVEEAPRTGSSHFSQKFSKVFRRSSSQRQPAENKQRQSGGSGIWYSDEDEEEEERFIPSFSRRASGPDTPRPLTHKTGEHWSELKAHAKRAAGAMVMSKEERRRAALRAKIRVVPEGQEINSP